MSDSYFVDQQGNGWVPQMHLIAERDRVKMLEKDQRRLEWLIATEQFVTNTASGYIIHKEFFEDWRDAIDEAMGVSNE